VTAADHGIPLELHPDRLFPVDPTVRAIARELYDAVRELPLICPHGHVDPRRLAFDQPFENPTSLLVSSDHYVTRLLHASGLPLDELGVGDEALSEDRARGIWRLFCGHWDVYRGTAVRYWLECQLVELFGVAVRPSFETADAIYDRILECLRDDAFRPRALYARFGVEVLATTDDPCDDLGAHEVLVDDPSWAGRVIPTFRPDRYLEAGQPGWAGAIAELAEASGIDTGDYAGYIDALEQRRQHFIAHGATTATPTRAPIRSTLPMRSASTGQRSRARPPRLRRSPSAGTWCWRWRGCRATTGS
jgi:glucuronate isomerase